ncbi:MAG: hypothetical protein AB8B85_23745 [Paracoccaceae bacterium]
MVGRSLTLVLCLGLAACDDPEANSFTPGGLTDVFVADFHSDKPAFCDANDVPLSHSDAGTFFGRSKIVTNRELHDHYDLAPCHIEGTAKTGNQLCNWKIRPGGTALVSCGAETWNLVCDDCEDLYKD